MSASASTEGQGKIKGELTVKVIRCHDLAPSRLMGKMDPYVKLKVVEGGNTEKFKTKVCENGHTAPEWNQAFLFNIDAGAEATLHIRVLDSELLSDTCIGRADIPIRATLESLDPSNSSRTFDLHHPDEFRKMTGKIDLSFSFRGEGAPNSPAAVLSPSGELVSPPPISGAFHFQHNSTGLIIQPEERAYPGSKLQLKAGGLGDVRFAFEFIGGSYIQALGQSGDLYLSVGEDGKRVVLDIGMSERSRWKWTGASLQSLSASTNEQQMLIHPKDDAMQAGTPIVIQSGMTPAAGFSLVPCSGVQVSEPGAGTWRCIACAYTNESSASQCVMCRAPSTGPTKDHKIADYTFELDFKHTWPPRCNVSTHPHPLEQMGEVYQGTYVCDLCKLQGQGTTYHCKKCQFDMHPACARKKLL